MSQTSDQAPANRLIHATSPYLLQHAHNPVDWYEWSPEALEKAREENKPIFLSIGYAACHWCHVMEHECFEDAEVAAALNKGFVSVKVDREERPDLDELYMNYTQSTTGHGGWPMSVWLLPDGRPFFAGTYFPKPQFMNALEQIATVWKNEPERIRKAAEQGELVIGQMAASPPPAEGVVPRETIDRAAGTIGGYFDRSRGGISGGGTNKFPPSMAMDLMLRVYRLTQKSDLFDAVKVTLDNMARGGIYDHLGGGICRYSTDVEWLVPHFEKMLYDQALVSSIYLDAYQLNHDPLYGYIAADIFDYVLADLTSPEGGFYSSRDADSDGLEGKFYIWTAEEFEEALGKEDARLFCAYYDVTPTGNWFERFGHAPPGPKNILHITKPLEVFARMHNLSVEELEAKLGSWREKLLEIRARRTPPALDDKVLTSWNGLMIAALAKGAVVLDQPKYAQAAERAATFILTNLQKDGRLLRTWRKGQARLTGYLSDYAYFIEGLLNLYEATFDRKWLDEAVRLTDTAVRHYYDESAGGFYFTADDAEKLIARSKHPFDAAIPSGNSVMAKNLLRLAILLDRKDYRGKAEGILRLWASQVDGAPTAFENLLCAADFYHDRVKEIAIVGDPKDAETKALLRVVFDRYLPNKVVVLTPDADPSEKLPLLARKTKMNGKPTAYVCEQYNCQRPVNSAEELAKQLESTSPPE
ncbi:MAG: thioredoxin domain-containing protein [Phycisphaerae bacterium]|nr:thioredoxin domain-containing protein [Phycisphaerae bacterium]